MDLLTFVNQYLSVAWDYLTTPIPVDPSGALPPLNIGNYYIMVLFTCFTFDILAMLLGHSRGGLSSGGKSGRSSNSRSK